MGRGRDVRPWRVLISVGRCIVIGVLLAAPFAGVLALVLGGVWWEFRSVGAAWVPVRPAGRVARAGGVVV